MVVTSTTATNIVPYAPNRCSFHIPDLSAFPDLTFGEVESYTKTASGCEHTAKGYKFFAEPGYIHNVKGELSSDIFIKSGLPLFFSIWPIHNI